MPIKPSRLVLSVVLIGALSPGLSPVFAQTTSTTRASLTPVALAPITSAQRERMSRSLVTVQTVTLLRDRGVLDEAQRERVATLERDLAAALAARDAVTGNATQAQARLEQARAAFDAEVTTLASANQGLVREIAALRADTIVQASRLSDEEVRQRQRFADGDTRALDIMDALATQREAAIDLAAKQRRAESRRDMARNFAIAVGRGDAGRTSADVLTRWDEAAALDPSDFWTHIERARLARTIGNLPRSRAAAEDSVRAAREDWERGLSQESLGDIAVLQGDLGTAGLAYQEYLRLYRSLVTASPNQTGLTRNLSVSLNKIGDVAIDRGDLAGANAAYSEGLVIRRRLAEADPSSTEAQRDLLVSFSRVGDVAIARGDFISANSVLSEGLVIARRLSAADPASALAQRGVSVSLQKLGDVAKARGNLAEATTLYSESSAIARRLSLADPSSAEAQRSLGVSLLKLAGLQGSNIRWAEVAAHWRAMKRDGVLAPSDDRLLTEIEEMAAQEARGTLPAAAPARR